MENNFSQGKKIAARAVNIQSKEHCIVAIGASAGGLEAIHEFFDNVPENTNLSFILVQHLSPDYKSLLVELVSKHTHMNVFEAEQDMKVQKNCVYVIPNNKLMTIKHGSLKLMNKFPEKGPNTSIDIFLQSLAEDKGPDAIAVVLSGTGTDGTKGIEAIKAAGGFVLVQDPCTAKFDGMPNSAIASGNADMILAPELMPEEIYTRLQESPVHILNKGKIDENLLEEIFRLIYRQSGNDFHFYKIPTIIRRISRRMVHRGIMHLEEYVTFLRNNPEECKNLCKDFLIGVTKFFRDPAVYEILHNDVFPELISKKDQRDAFKIWVVACSTGEEAYSIGIIVDRFLTAHKISLDVKIFATDIDEAALEVASKGVYPETIVKDINADILERYFIKEGNQYHIIPQIRKQIVFAKHNIIKDPPFIKNDMVSCRNMLIYMSNILQKKVMSTLHFSLNNGSYLLLGPSETVVAMQDNLEEVNSKWKIFKKNGTQMPHTDSLYSKTVEFGKFSRDLRPERHRSIGKTSRDISAEFNDVLSEEFGYAAFYIDANYEIKEATGNYKKYISLPDGRLHLNLLKLLPPELSIALNSAIRKAQVEQKKISVKSVRIKGRTRSRYISLIVKPNNKDISDSLMLIVFGEVRAQRSGIKPSINIPTDLAPELNKYIMDLEQELRETRVDLQMAIEGLETSNEELQSSNEELLSANEELQSSNEELQSLNEELHTLNTEHQLKIRELVELNDDLNNYFRSADIAQIFLDANMTIRKFNPAANKLINLIETDIGRPIGHISTNITHSTLIDDIQRVLHSSEIVEKELKLNNGKNSLMRILPYVRQDNQMDGVIITFVDITDLREKDNIIKGVFDSSPSAILAFNAVRDEQGQLIDLKWVAGNYAADKLLERNNADYIGKRLKQEFTGIFEYGFFEKFVNVIHHGIPLKFEYNYNGNGLSRWLDITAVKMMDGVMVTLTDVSEKKEAEEKLRKNYSELVQVKENLRKLNTELEDKVISNIEQRKFLAESMPFIVWTASPEGDLNFLNKEFEKYSGLSVKDGLEWGWEKIIHPEDQPELNLEWHRALRQKRNFSIQARLRKHDGSYCWHIMKASPRKDNEGQLLTWVGSFTDIHDQKMANEVLEHRVKERTRELQQINDELESSNIELQQFASVASHDLKEPLRKIHMFSNLIKDKYFRNVDEAAISYLDRIIHSSARMTTLVNDLLSFSRLSVNQLFRLTDLNQLLKDIVADLELTIQEKNAEVDISELPVIEAVPGQMRQVFQNLLSNALKFSKKEEPPVIRIRSEIVAGKSLDSKPANDGNYCRITVIDNGIGFDEQYRDKIFTIFQRLHTKEQYEGTGIGLAITKKIIDKHNGLISASSIERKGSCFIIILPLVQRESGTLLKR